ncbi:hypothetical protein glysoja_042869 [Glycine soja]|uniref:Uncharacterized protein n=1 Tax=Glycine soja TaxID=3848 RepID=A0A0B2R1R4_GLYSO|nr:hypothetical protein glysoja_042869 [Glycine soja]
MFFSLTSNPLPNPNLPPKSINPNPTLLSIPRFLRPSRPMTNNAMFFSNPLPNPNLTPIPSCYVLSLRTLYLSALMDN